MQTTEGRSAAAARVSRGGGPLRWATIGRVQRFPEHLRQHFERPERVGEPEGGADLVGEARNAACGDHLVVYLRCEPAPGGAERVTAAGFRAQGCPAAMATASAACSVIAGLPADATLPAALAARFEQRFGAPAPAHRHALALFSEALSALRPAGPAQGAQPRPGDAGSSPRGGR